MGGERLKGVLLSTLVMVSIIVLAVPLSSPSSVHAALTAHGPIYIDGNAGFTAPDPVNGGGSGTENDPYIIENWAINASGATGIDIRNTTAYFIIRNCLVENGRSGNRDGIYLNNVVNGKIENCTCSNNSYSIYLYSSSNNTLTNNSCSNNNYGIYLDRSSNNNTLTNNSCFSNNGGIVLEYSLSNNTLTYNTCDNNSGYGIRLHSSFNSTLTNNSCSNNGDGIFLVHSDTNTISNNTVKNNSYGIRFWDSDINRIYHNNLINNNNQAYDDGTNFWDDGYPSGGNYWSDYTGLDENRGENHDIPGADGIGDTPYNIPGGSNQDRYPLMNPVVNGLVSRPPIYINGNDNFTPANGVTSGSGTDNDSYIIENWVINASGATGIEIRNTTAYFIIRNCFVENGGGSWKGIYFVNVGNGKIENCTCDNNSYGISLPYSNNNNTLTNNSCDNNKFDGIYLSSSSNNTLTNNTCSNNVYDGIELYPSCNYNTLTNNSCSNNSYGIRLDHSSNNTLDNNTCFNNYCGIYICYSWSSNYNTLTNNSCSNNSYGIYLNSTSNNTLDNNSCSNNRYNFGVWAPPGAGDISYFDHDIDNSNLVDGRPIYYLRDRENEVIDPSWNPGYVGLVRCDNIRVENLVLENNQEGILLAGTENSWIENCTCSNNSYLGIVLLYSSNNNTLDNNTCSNNPCGIELYSSSNNTIENNTCSNNSHGIQLSSSSSNNTLTNNICGNNGYGIGLGNGSSNNTLTNNICNNNSYGIELQFTGGNNRIFHNNFINNTNQTYGNDANFWDNGYPSGGNYWSNYTGADNYRGENQDIPGSDGIGDTPYYVAGGAMDRYPLMNPWPGGGMVTFRLENLYTVTLEGDLWLYQGSKLVMKFYDYRTQPTYENEVVIESFIPPAHVEENENVPHPSGIGVKNVRLVLTTDDTANEISTIASFTVTKGVLASRYLEIKGEYVKPGADRPALANEYLKIKSQYVKAPS